MKKPLRTLFYGTMHEHAPGKLETLKKLSDDFEVVAIVDDRPRKSPTYHARYDHDLKVHELTLMACGYGR